MNISHAPESLSDNQKSARNLLQEVRKYCKSGGWNAVREMLLIGKNGEEGAIGLHFRFLGEPGQIDYEDLLAFVDAEKSQEAQDLANKVTDRLEAQGTEMREGVEGILTPSGRWTAV